MTTILKKKIFPGRALRAVALLAAVLAAAGTARAAGVSPPRQSGRRTNLVPATWSYISDAQGYRWDLNNRGMVNDGTSDCFDGGLVLNVNGQQFNGNTCQMTPDGSEYYLESLMASAKVERIVLVDKTDCVARYVEFIENTGTSTGTYTLQVFSCLGGSSQNCVSDMGRASPTSLDKKEGGIVAVQYPNGGRPSVLFAVAHPKTRKKPDVSVDGNRRNYSTTYTLKLRPGEKAAVMHLVAQRRFTSPTPTAKELAAEYKLLYSKKWLKTVPAKYRRYLANWTRSGIYGPDSSAFWSMPEELGISQETTDILAVGETSRLHGKASCSKLTVTGRFGATEIPFEDVAAVTGLRYSGRKGSVYLRNGELLRGEIAAGDLAFTMQTGVTIAVSMKGLDRLVLHGDKKDGKPAEGAAALLETYDGNRLLVKPDGCDAFSFLTAWGAYTARIDEMESLKPTESEPLGFMLRLKDGTSMFGFLDAPGFKLQTVRFGQVQFGSGEIRRLAFISESGSLKEDPAEIVRPHLILAGENVIVGDIDLPVMDFVLSGEVVPVPPNQVRSMVNAGVNAEGGGLDMNVLFTVELWGGGLLNGSMRENRLPVRVGQQVWRIPVNDILEVRVPSPAVPDNLRDKIAQMIRELGHPEWEVREAATTGLLELGALARMQLDEARKHTTDPEVRRRAERLLEEIKE
ncbi:MAG: hypothetical protein JW909_01045 [Planctomycetes bacterium]|nr:hypothetical protein [Planctomycetota bacterium]